MNRRIFLEKMCIPVGASLVPLSWSAPLQAADNSEVIISSPDTSLFHHIILPGHAGLHRTGINDLEQISAYQGIRDTTPINAFNMNFRSWDALKRLSAYAPVMDIELIKQSANTSGTYQLDTSKYGDNINQYILNQFVMDQLSQINIYLLSDEVLKEYFSNEKDPFRTRNTGKDRYFGGTAANAFQARRSFMAYMDNILPVLAEWSQSTEFTEDFFAVREFRLPNYNFDHGGYLFPLLQMLSGHGLVSDQEKDRLTALYHPVTGRRSRDAGLLIPMNESNAEALTVNYANKTLYSVYRARSFVNTTDLVSTPINFEQEILSNEIEIFADIALTEKVMDVPLS